MAVSRSLLATESQKKQKIQEPWELELEKTHLVVRPHFPSATPFPRDALQCSVKICCPVTQAGSLPALP